MFKLQLLTLLFCLLGCCLLAIAAPYQELEPRKGHVPVYIRHGDESLANIHPGLAEAFNEATDKDSSKPLLQAENLIKEVTTATIATTAATSSQEAGEGEATPSSTTVKSSTESDIASFDAIKAKDV